MKCKNDVFMRMVGGEKLDKSVRVDFDVQRFLPDCRKIKADRYVSTSAASPTYDRLTIPANQFECMNPNCVNSGTLRNGGAKTVYKTVDGEEFASGVITFYVTENVTSATVAISDTEAGTNADSYTVTPGTAVNGFKPVVVDLSQTPTAEVGTGWTPADGYTYIAITLSGSSSLADTEGLSSIAIFDDLEDFQTSTHVQAACLTTVDGSWDLEVAENTCFANSYNDNESRSFEKTMTFKKVTPNYWRLNPLWKRGDATTGFDIVTVEKTIRAGTGALASYGVIDIDDMDQDECRFFSVQLADDPCDITEASLEKLSLPVAVDLDQKHYVVVDAGSGMTDVLFNSGLIGKKIIVSYPKAVEVEQFIITDEDINELRTSFTYVRKYTDGHKYRFRFNRVLVTSFSDTISEDENEFSITFSIQKDEKGRYGYADRIIG